MRCWKRMNDGGSDDSGASEKRSQGVEDWLEESPRP
jgi:hypothetical protein